MTINEKNRLLIALLTLGVLLVFVLQSHAATRIDPTGGGRWVAPPAKYVHPYRGTLKIFLNETPFAIGAFWPTYGYTFVIPGTTTCIMQVWRPYWSTSLYRHERAHCLGWAWNHPPY